MITENGEYNYTRIIGVLLIIAFIIYAVVPWNIIFPPKIVIPINNNTTIIYKEIIKTITVTPTPDNGVYYVGEFQNGTRKLNRPFTWTHEDATGLKDMWVTVTCYDYKILKSYNWFNVFDYKYYKQYPDDITKKFIFVFINIEMNDITGDDTRLWLPNRNLFAIQYKGDIYSPVDYPLNLRIKEFEEKFDYNDVDRVKAYAQFNYQDLTTGKQTSIQNLYLRGGTSNSEDGHILFEIPRDAEPKDLILLGNFFGFGNSQWRLA